MLNENYERMTNNMKVYIVVWDPLDKDIFSICDVFPTYEKAQHYVRLQNNPYEFRIVEREVK